MDKSRFLSKEDIENELKNVKPVPVVRPSENDLFNSALRALGDAAVDEWRMILSDLLAVNKELQTFLAQLALEYVRLVEKDNADHTRVTVGDLTTRSEIRHALMRAFRTQEALKRKRRRKIGNNNINRG